MKNKISLFYDEFPSDLLQPDDGRKIMFGTFVYHKNINGGTLFDNELLTQYMDCDDLKYFSAYAKKTELLRKFLENKFVKYKNEKTQKESIYNTSDFVWCTICCFSFSHLYKEFINNPPDFTIFYDPKSLNSELKNEFQNYLQEEIIYRIKKIINQKIPLPKITIEEGRKKMMGIKIADKMVRKNYGNFNGGNSNFVNITETLNLSLKKLLKVGIFSDDRRFNN